MIPVRTSLPDIPFPLLVGVVALGIAAAFSLLQPPQPRDAIAGQQFGPAGATILGTNLGYLEYWDTQLVYANIGKQKEEWREKQQGVAGFAANGDGWPTALGTAGKATSYLSFFVPGTYTLYVQGKGTLVFGGDIRDTIIKSNSPELTRTYQVTPSGSLTQILITSTDPADPLRFELYLPGHDRPDVFYRPFLANLQPFRVLRFLDAAGINNAQTSSWSQRTLPSYHTQSPVCCNPPKLAGMSYEDMVALSQYTGADLWINIPHLADDNYVTQLGIQILRPYLQQNPARKVYIEYSNELWNGGFGQTQWVQQQGLSRGYSSIPWQAGIRMNVVRSSQIFDLLTQALGGEASRMVKVVGTQVGNAGVTTEICQSLRDTTLNPKGTVPDAIAGGLYFGGNVAGAIPANQIPTITPAQIVQLATNDIPADIGTNAQNTLTEISRECPLPAPQLMAYEGGQHLVDYSNNPVLVQKLADANRDPLMQQAYDAMFDEWERVNPGRLFMHYNSVGSYSPYGSWGALEDENQAYATAPKHLSLQGRGGSSTSCTTGQTRSCGSSVGSCRLGTQTCQSGQWGSCTGGIGPGTEMCNGLDDDCDGQVDNILPQNTPPCSKQLGVCRGAAQTCQSGQWADCSDADYGVVSGAYQPSEVLCTDGLDNDCNGITDWGASCPNQPLPFSLAGSLAPGGTKRQGQGSVSLVGNTYTLAYREGGSVLAQYEIDVTDPSVRDGLLRIYEKVSATFPVAGGGMMYRKLDNTLLDPSSLAQLSSISSFTHRLGNGIVSLIYDELVEGKTLRKRYDLELKGNTLILHAHTDGRPDPSPTGNYAGFSFGGNDRATNPKIVEVTYSEVAPLTVTGQPGSRFFLSTYPDWTRSASNKWPWTISNTNPPSYHKSYAHFYDKRQINLYTPVDEVGYITVSPSPADALLAVHQQPSAYRSQLNNRIWLDLYKITGWPPLFQPLQGFKFDRDSTLVSLLASWGMEDLIIHNTAWGDVGEPPCYVLYPTHFPPESSWGGLPGLQAMVGLAHQSGYLTALYQIYTDMFDTPVVPGGLPGPQWNPANLIEDVYGKPVNYGFVNGNCPSYQSVPQPLVIRPDRWLPYAVQESPLIKSAVGTSATYLDVHLKVPPTLMLDFSSTDTVVTASQWFGLASSLAAFQQAAFKGPLLSEGGNVVQNPTDTTYAGLIDIVEGEIANGDKAPVIPDFELKEVQPVMVRAGMGHPNRWVGVYKQPLNHWTFDWDKLRATQLAMGHSGFMSDIALFEDTAFTGSGGPTYPAYHMDVLYSILRAWVKEYYLFRDLQEQYLSSAATTILYRNAGGALLPLATAIDDPTIDLFNPQLFIHYANGLDLYINRQQAGQPWKATVQGTDYYLPPNGWLAVNPAENFLEYSGLMDANGQPSATGFRGDVVHSKNYVFVDGRWNPITVLDQCGAPMTATGIGVRKLTGLEIGENPAVAYWFTPATRARCPPALSSLAPSPAATGATVLLRGTAFDPSAQILLDGQPSPLVSFSYVHDQLISLTVLPSSISGTFTVTVRNSDGQESAGLPLTLHSTGDDDGDGVPNYLEQCPSTPPGLAVNQAGCPLPLASKFTPSLTTSFASVPNLQAVQPLTLGIAGQGKIDFGSQPISLLRTVQGVQLPLDLDTSVDIGPNSIGIDPLALPELNFPATLTLYGLTFQTPVVLRDGAACTACQIISYASGDLVFSVPGFSTYIAAESSCGDTVCSGGETCSSCPGDCGACQPACGNSVCDVGETCSSCPVDCGACTTCGDGQCGSGETCSSCPGDCGSCGGGGGGGGGGPSSLCLPGQSKVCGSNIGICSEGNRSCQSGQWGSCTGGIGPGTETCNGLDDDCDGQVDELTCLCLLGQSKPCGSNIGSCREGVRTCDAGGNWGSCTGDVQPAAEVCGNALDDDCDTELDESCGPAPETCSNGLQDVDEQGIDCGGSCPNTCTSPPQPADPWAVALLASGIAGFLVAAFIRLRKRRGLLAHPSSPSPLLRSLLPSPWHSLVRSLGTQHVRHEFPPQLCRISLSLFQTIQVRRFS